MLSAPVSRVGHDVPSSNLRGPPGSVGQEKCAARGESQLPPFALLRTKSTLPIALPPTGPSSSLPADGGGLVAVLQTREYSSVQSSCAVVHLETRGHVEGEGVLDESVADVLERSLR